MEKAPPFSKAMPLQTLLLVKGDGTHRFLEGEEGVGFVGGINDDITPPVYKVGGPLPLLMTRRTSSFIKRDRGTETSIQILGPCHLTERWARIVTFDDVCERKGWYSEGEEQ